LKEIKAIREAIEMYEDLLDQTISDSKVSMSRIEEAKKKCEETIQTNKNDLKCEREQISKYKTMIKILRTKLEELQSGPKKEK